MPAPYEPGYYPDNGDDDSIDLRELWRIVVKYRRTIALFTAIVVVTVVVATMMRLPEYRATAVLEVSPRTQTVVEFQNVQGTNEDAATYLRTQIQIIKSRVIAEAVVKDLDLANEPAFNGQIRQRDLMGGLREVVSLVVTPLVSTVKQMLQGGPDAEVDTDAASSEAERETARLRSLTDRLRGNLEVTPIRSSNLIEISFQSLDSQLAADVANAVANEYLRFSARKRFERSAGAETHLKDEIANLQAQLETSEKELYAFARKNQVVDLEDRNNIIATRLTKLNADLAQVKGERIAAESAYDQLSRGNVDSLPGVLNDPQVSKLKSELASLRAEYARLGQTYTAEYPKMLELQSKMDAVRQTLELQLGNLLASFEAKYAELTNREQRLTESVDEQKRDLLELQDRAVQYNILKRQWETNRELYSGMLERMKEVGVAAGIERDAASVIDSALVPRSPFAPNLPKNFVIAMVLGLMGGVGLALLLNLLDNTVRSPEEIERLVHVANLGMVPRIDPKSIPADVPLDLMSFMRRDGNLPEAYRSVRTSLMFATPGGAPKTLMITSATPGEGKSTSTVNLGIVLAQTGASVLIVDADLRKPRLHKVFNVPRGPGLTECLVQGDVADAYHATDVENLSFLPAGTPPPNPAELLSARSTDDLFQQLRQRFDYIIIDTSPVMGLADPVVLSTKVDGVLLLSAAGKVTRGALREAVKRLRSVDAPLVGSVLNLISSESSDYAYYNHYYYNYRSTDDDQALEKAAA
ncbi:MAG: polysaccharide biosynthesis tyrosine autokinase [Chromatiaceae bacterium]|nr:polysaccharide biosynthesis tyrosine autokinase [Chromatiaceae bacterium]